MNLSIKSPKQVQQYMQSHKICKRQSQRICDIIEYFKASCNKGRNKFIASIKSRITNEFEVSIMFTLACALSDIKIYVFVNYRKIKEAVRNVALENVSRLRLSILSIKVLPLKRNRRNTLRV